MPSPRVLKLADQIKIIVAEMLERRIKDPRLGFITITDVSLTGDTREATVFYTVMGTDTDLVSTAAALQSATGLIRSHVGRQLGLRHAPSLTFIADAVPKEAAHIEELLAAARRGDADVAERSAGAQYAGDPDPYKRDDDPETELDNEIDPETDSEIDAAPGPEPDPAASVDESRNPA